MYRKILVPVDGSQPSAAGLSEAIKLAKNQGSEIRLVHVVSDPILDYRYCAGVYAGDAMQTLRKFGRDILSAAEMEAQRRGVKTSVVLLESVARPPSDVILDEAKAWSADLVVMGTHGRRGVARMVMGSDAEAVVRACTVPVLLVRGDQQKSVQAPRLEASGA
jgi:nucleotide-binding universal stress UspA family protein